MPSFRTRRLVRHTPSQMFDLVADIGRYPEFVPMCEGMKITSRTADATGIETVLAAMTVGYKFFRETFVSQAVLNRETLLITSQYIDGPFRSLDNRWQFHADPIGCAVDFYIDYEFKSLALQLLMGSVFDLAFRKLSGAFEARADAIYGRARSQMPAST